MDDLEEHYINIDLRDDDLAGNDHQGPFMCLSPLTVGSHDSAVAMKSIYFPTAAEPENITLFETFGSGVAETDLYNHFERY